nr:signal peptidase I [Propionibacterium sp.]
MLINVVVALAVVSLVQAFVVRVHNVSSGSMRETLGVTDRVLTFKLAYVGAGPARGDIVVFAHGDSWETDRRSPDPSPVVQALRAFGDLTGIGLSSQAFTVKRVIGVAGDTVDCCDADGRVRVNGEALTEPYVYRDIAFRPGELDCTTEPRSARCFGPVQVPADRLLVLGDHRSNSADSVANCRSADARPDACARFVRVDQVTGKVIARVWPPGPVA